MPRPSFPSPRARIRRALGTAAYVAWLKSMDRRKPRDEAEGGVPVEPNRPLNLSGGAAEPLEFED